MLARLLPLVPEYISDPVLNWFTGCYSFPNQRTFKKMIAAISTRS